MLVFFTKFFNRPNDKGEVSLTVSENDTLIGDNLATPTFDLHGGAVDLDQEIQCVPSIRVDNANLDGNGLSPINTPCGADTDFSGISNDSPSFVIALPCTDYPDSDLQDYEESLAHFPSLPQSSPPAGNIDTLEKYNNLRFYLKLDSYIKAPLKLLFS